MLRLETIESKTLSLLERIQCLPELEDTRLVGGTALAMQLPHRPRDLVRRDVRVAEPVELVFNCHGANFACCMGNAVLCAHGGTFMSDVPI